MHTVQNGGTRSKRVMASQEQDQPARVTRQRTREQQQVQACEEGVQDSTTNAEDNDSHLDDQINLCNEGQSRCRGISLGKGLHRLTRSLSTNIPVHIAEGNKRPEAPMKAAKLASECGIVLRQHIPVLTHWKEYKNGAYLDEYMGKVFVNFAIDTTNKVVVDACVDLLRSGQRQLRHKLKKKCFDGKLANEVPTTLPVSTITDEQWKALVAMWSSAKHKEKCLANKRSREKLRYPHKTGSRCYLAQLAVLAQMEAFVDEHAEEGQVPKTPQEAVVEVLASTRFLKSASLQPAVANKTSKSVYAARVQELEAQVQELQAGNENAIALQNQVVVLVQELVESEVTRDKEIGALKKHIEETDAILRRLLSLNK